MARATNGPGRREVREHCQLRAEPREHGSDCTADLADLAWRYGRGGDRKRGEVALHLTFYRVSSFSRGYRHGRDSTSSDRVALPEMRAPARRPAADARIVHRSEVQLL